MNYKDLELHIAQVETAIKVCRRSFKDKKKQKIYHNLIHLFEAVKSSNYTSFDVNKLQYCRDHILKLIYIGVEFLHYKSKKDIPSQLTYCLNMVLKDWLDDPSLFQIAFSPNNSLADFYIYALDEAYISALNLSCQQMGIQGKYEQSLIHISYPRFFKNDFMSSIPVYHELGHFIDFNYSISYNMVRDRTFQPAVLGRDRGLLMRYVSEHFADLFAAQYLGTTMAKSLNYYAYKNPRGPEHPSTDERISIIEAFVSGSGTPDELDIISRLISATETQTRRKRVQRSLENRSVPLSKDPFFSDKGLKLNDPSELHSMFSKAWDSFMDSPEFIKKYPQPFTRMNRVNQIVKKTIDSTANHSNFPTILSLPWSK